MRLQIVGGGKMGEALVGGVLDSGWATPEELAVVELAEDRCVELADRYPGVVTGASIHPNVDALIAVKPQHVLGVVELLEDGGVQRLLCVAAGITVASMEAAGPTMRVVRCMPNTPALIGAGASAIAPGTTATDADMAWAESILQAVGLVERVAESDIDAVTGLSGSGPAYVFHLAEALIAAATTQGLAPDVADRLARQTLLGASRLLAESGEDPAILRQNVTSPGGTTAAGLAVFDDADFMGLIDRVVAAAADRSRELGDS